MNGPTPAPTVSVVIPVRNRPDGIRACLESLTALDYPPGRVEVLVIDDASTDDTPAVVAAYPDASVNLVAQPVNRGQSECRNIGAEAATGELVAFIDSDCLAGTAWLSTLAGTFANPGVVAAGGAVREARPVTWIARYEAAMSPLHKGEQPARVVPGSSVDFLPSCNLVVRRQAFLDAGGFDASLRFGEDVDLVWRLCDRGEVRYEPLGAVWHEHRDRLRPFLGNRLRYVAAQSMFLKRFPQNRRRLELPVGLVIGVALGAGLVALHPAAAATALAPGLIEAVALRSRRGAEGPSSFLDSVRRVARGYAAVLYRAVAHAGRFYAVLAMAVSAVLGLVWPVAFVATAVAAGILLAPGPIEWLRRRPPLDLIRFTAVLALDNLAVNAGAVVGCITQRTLGPLRLSIRLCRSVNDLPPARWTTPEVQSPV